MSRDKYYIGIIIIIIISFFIREGCNRAETNQLVADISNYKTESQTYKTKLGLEINTNRALALKTQDQIKTLLASNDTLKEWVNQFKKIKGGVVVRETTIIQQVAVPFDKIIPCDFKPFPAKKETKYFQFYATIANTGLTLDSLKIPNESRIIIGEKRKGFLNLKSELVVDVNNSNPYIRTSNISGYIYEPEKKWFEKMWVNFLAGMSIGYLGGRLDKK